MICVNQERVLKVKEAITQNGRRRTSPPAIPFLISF